MDNLLGNREYCPIIRRTDRLNAAMQQQLQEEAKKIVEGADPALVARAVHYLFTKETKSSFAIEGEVPSADRTLRFVAALGHADNFDTGNKQAFVELQNSIVDSRYAQKDWRTIQNYVGQTASNFFRNCTLHLSKAGRHRRSYGWLDAHGSAHRGWGC